MWVATPALLPPPVRCGRNPPRGSPATPRARSHCRFKKDTEPISKSGTKWMTEPYQHLVADARLVRAHGPREELELRGRRGGRHAQPARRPAAAGEDGVHRRLAGVPRRHGAHHPPQGNHPRIRFYCAGAERRPGRLRATLLAAHAACGRRRRLLLVHLIF